MVVLGFYTEGSVVPQPAGQWPKKKRQELVSLREVLQPPSKCKAPPIVNSQQRSWSLQTSANIHWVSLSLSLSLSMGVWTKFRSRSTRFCLFHLHNPSECNEVLPYATIYKSLIPIHPYTIPPSAYWVSWWGPNLHISMATWTQRYLFLGARPRLQKKRPVSRRWTANSAPPPSRREPAQAGLGDL